MSYNTKEHSEHAECFRFSFLVLFLFSFLNFTLFCSTTLGKPWCQFVKLLGLLTLNVNVYNHVK